VIACTVQAITTGKDESPIAADVYGDVGESNSSCGTEAATFHFRIAADAEPDVFARVAAIFNIANTAPRRATLQRDSHESVIITVDIELSAGGTAKMIRRKLEQLTSILSVEGLIGKAV
jgi:glycine cleavage system regulatory protein